MSVSLVSYYKHYLMQLLIHNSVLSIGPTLYFPRLLNYISSVSYQYSVHFLSLFRERSSSWFRFPDFSSLSSSSSSSPSSLVPLHSIQDATWRRPFISSWRARNSPHPLVNWPPFNLWFFLVWSFSILRSCLRLP